MLAAMVIIIIFQVFSRQIFSYTPSWSEELSRVLFVWVAFLGIAYGFKEKLHIALGLVVDRMPEKVQEYLRLFCKDNYYVIWCDDDLLWMEFYYINGEFNRCQVQGCQVKYPYASIPVSGFYVTIYGINTIISKKDCIRSLTMQRRNNMGILILFGSFLLMLIFQSSDCINA